MSKSWWGRGGRLYSCLPALYRLGVVVSPEEVLRPLGEDSSHWGVYDALQNNCYYVIFKSVLGDNTFFQKYPYGVRQLSSHHGGRVKHCSIEGFIQGKRILECFFGFIETAFLQCYLWAVRTMSVALNKNNPRGTLERLDRTGFGRFIKGALTLATPLIIPASFIAHYFFKTLRIGVRALTSPIYHIQSVAHEGRLLGAKLSERGDDGKPRINSRASKIIGGLFGLVACIATGAAISAIVFFSGGIAAVPLLALASTTLAGTVSSMLFGSCLLGAAIATPLLGGAAAYSNHRAEIEFAKTKPLPSVGSAPSLPSSGSTGSMAQSLGAAGGGQQDSAAPVPSPPGPGVLHDAGPGPSRGCWDAICACFGGQRSRASSETDPLVSSSPPPPGRRGQI